MVVSYFSREEDHRALGQPTKTIPFESSGSPGEQIRMSNDRKNALHELGTSEAALKIQNEALRKELEQIRESLRTYSYFYESSPFGCLTLDERGTLLEANATLARMLGAEKAHILGHALTDYIAEADQEAFRRHLRELFRTGERQTCDVRLQGEPEEPIWIQLESLPIENGADRKLCKTAAVDISAHKRVEEALLKSEVQYRKLSQEFDALLNAISDTLVLLSPRLKVLWANRGTAYRVVGEPGELMGRHCHEYFFGRPEPCEDCPVARSFASGKEETQVSMGGGKFLDKRAFPIMDGSVVNSVILVISDITDKMTMQAEAMQAAHLASVGELAAGVAHEINNPINGIINYAQVLLNECSPGSLETDIGGRIVKEGERIADIVKSLLSFTREGRDDKWPTRIDEVLKESLLLTQAQIRKESIRLSIDLPDDLPEVNANFQQIQQVILNIISNARYALNEKYPARHENKAIEIVGEKVLVDCREHVCITFVDHGVGIPAERLAMLTKPFFTTKPLGRGTGLGLSISQRILQDHDGRLTFDSVEGEYTRVTVELPVRRHGNGHHSCHR